MGLLTGGVTAAVLWGCSLLLPWAVAVLLAIGARVLLTGALHEDGLADFCDGLGGGTSRAQVLFIMKDSHIGTYGVIGLILYFLLYGSLLYSLPLPWGFGAVIAADVWCKFTSSQIINLLPYARKEEESKAKVVYSRMSVAEFCAGAVIASATLCLLLPLPYLACALAPVIVFLILGHIMKVRIGGYTGDCCGALFLTSEIAFYLGLISLVTLMPLP